MNAAFKMTKTHYYHNYNSGIQLQVLKL